MIGKILFSWIKKVEVKRSSSSLSIKKVDEFVEIAD
jgi:hypothetical protein